MKNAEIFLLPTPLVEEAHTGYFTAFHNKTLSEADIILAENERTARRFIKKVCPHLHIPSLDIRKLNKDTDAVTLNTFIEAIEKNKKAIIMSEAGCPGIADPGSQLIALAHERHIKVTPLIGPSSILLALMASGLNGQNFCFHGYLPIDGKQRNKRLIELEAIMQQTKQTQLFIETPYRNEKLFDTLLKTCKPNTTLCIAANLTGEQERIFTKKITDWKKMKKPIWLNKQPAIFLIGAVS